MGGRNNQPKGVRYGGRPKGGKNKATLEREAEIARAAAAVRGTEKAPPLGKEVLREAMMFFRSEAARFQPTRDDPGTKESREKFDKYLTLAAQCAKDLAPYESPKLSSVELSGSIEAQMTTFVFNIFEQRDDGTLIEVEAEETKQLTNGRNGKSRH